MVKKFIRFLKEQGVFVRFAKRFYNRECGVNCRRERYNNGNDSVDLSNCGLYEYLDKTKPSHYISNAFHWDANPTPQLSCNTDDEYFFWCGLEEDWWECLVGGDYFIKLANYIKSTKKNDPIISSFFERPTYIQPFCQKFQ